jgi:hypothetical protein
MMPPAALRVAVVLADRDTQSEQDLLRLDALLAEPTVVEDCRGLLKTWVWQKSLHGMCVRTF